VWEIGKNWKLIGMEIKWVDSDTCTASFIKVCLRKINPMEV
jgi:hypothetical protein